MTESSSIYLKIMFLAEKSVSEYSVRRPWGVLAFALGFTLLDALVTFRGIQPGVSYDPDKGRPHKGRFAMCAAGPFNAIR